jgi:hypothetical protein
MLFPPIDLYNLDWQKLSALKEVSRNHEKAINLRIASQKK